MLEGITFLEQVLEVFSVFLSQFSSSLHRAPSQIRAESTRVRTEASARWSHTRLRSSAPARRDSPGRSVSTVRSNLSHRSSEDFDLLPLCDQKSLLTGGLRSLLVLFGDVIEM